jgi:hypothetical protein
MECCTVLTRNLEWIRVGGLGEFGLGKIGPVRQLLDNGVAPSPSRNLSENKQQIG